ncbi:helix-turn-helix domain-containing protein [Bacillus fonticola]|uniref:helix-turn-helix domain-containing protein n=1 Tax=Bacillus fonticola TaxID=2728853 RepID=UPI001473E942|nr:XRE family transcriptional regulator [Bacillus fonticola]
MDHIPEQLGSKMKTLRHAKGYSLEELSKRTGVSKAMLGQIERGTSIPTVTTLWKIASGLHVSFTSLFSDDRQSPSVLRRNELSSLHDEEGYRVLPIIKFEPTKPFESFLLEIDARARHTAQPHDTYVEEYITVTKGTLSIEIGEESIVLGEGDSVRFQANVTHAYVNEGDSVTHAHLTIYYREKT